MIAGQLVLLTVGIALRLLLRRLLSSTTCAVDLVLVVSFCSFVIAVFLLFCDLSDALRSLTHFLGLPSIDRSFVLVLRLQVFCFDLRADQSII